MPASKLPVNRPRSFPSFPSAPLNISLTLQLAAAAAEGEGEGGGEAVSPPDFATIHFSGSKSKSRVICCAPLDCAAISSQGAAKESCGAAMSQRDVVPFRLKTTTPTSPSGNGLAHSSLPTAPDTHENDVISVRSCAFVCVRACMCECECECVVAIECTHVSMHSGRDSANC